MALREGPSPVPNSTATWAVSSLRLYRLSGTLRSSGGSHASATTSARVVGRNKLGRPRLGRSLRRLAAGAQARLAADGVEHALYVVGGRERAGRRPRYRTATRRRPH